MTTVDSRQKTNGPGITASSRTAERDVLHEATMGCGSRSHYAAKRWSQQPFPGHPFDRRQPEPGKITHKGAARHT